MPAVHEFEAFFRQRLHSLDEDDELIWISSDIPLQALRAAYPLGIFPWPGEDPDCFPWVAPIRRGVLPPHLFRLGKSTRRHLRNTSYKVTFDQAFPRVIRACAQARGHETWIHPKMIRAYTAAHHQGFARSVEIWENHQLVGGLYGIDLHGVFSGESMFHLRPNAGKAAIAALIHQLHQRPNGLLDIQQLTPHMAAMGAQEWSRDQFLQHLPHTTS